MKMRIQIDQSVKIEETNRDTVIGLSNGVEFAVVIPAKVKRKLQEEFRRRGKRRLFMYRTFAAGVVLLLHHASFRNLPSVTIDEEYPGHAQLLRSMILEMWTRLKKEVFVFTFARVGKRSGAHRVSHFTTIGKRKADKIISYGELKKLVLP